MRMAEGFATRVGLGRRHWVISWISFLRTGRGKGVRIFDSNTEREWLVLMAMGNKAILSFTWVVFQKSQLGNAVDKHDA